MEQSGFSEEELAKLYWKDEVFVNTYGLSIDNVMEYFSMSPFYDPTSINGLLRMQARFNRLDASKLSKSNMTGTDYAPTIFCEDPLSFIIFKHYRKADTEDVELLGAYYIIDSLIYQAPDFYTLVINRMIGSLYYVQQALEYAQREIKFHPEFGCHWDSKKDSTTQNEGHQDESTSRLDNSNQNNTEPGIKGYEGSPTSKFKFQNAMALKENFNRIIYNTTFMLIEHLNKQDSSG